MQPEQNYTAPAAYVQQPPGLQKQKKIIAAIVALGVLLIVAAIVVVLLSGPDERQKAGAITATHAETVRLLDEYGESASSVQAKSLVARTLVVFKSDLQELQRLGIGPTAKQQQAAAITGIDETMQDAVRNNRIDEQITEYIKLVVEQNQTVAEEVLTATDDEELKAVLQSVLDNYSNLL